MKEKKYAAFIGLDWANKKHDICLHTGEAKEFSTIANKPEAIDEWVQSLRARFHGEQIAIGLEQSKGGVIFALLKYDFLDIYPVNPSTLAHYREAFSPSRAKDDPTDAQYILKLLMQYREKLTCWQPEDEDTRKLEQLVSYRRKLVNDRARLISRLKGYLKYYYPQVIDWFRDFNTPLVAEFILQWLTPEELKIEDEQNILNFFKTHGSRKHSLNLKRLEAIKNMVILTTDPAIVVPTSLIVKSVCEELLLLSKNIKSFDTEINTLVSKHKDYNIFKSLPGAGDALAARLLTAFGTQRDRFNTANDAAKYFGIAPVMERSGNSTWIRWRYFCPRFLRQSFHEFAGRSIIHSFWAKAFYRKQREKGKSHHVAIRALAFKWIRIIFKCWKDKKPYSEVQYLKVLQKKNSPLLTYAANNNI